MQALRRAGKNHCTCLHQGCSSSTSEIGCSQRSLFQGTGASNTQLAQLSVGAHEGRWNAPCRPFLALATARAPCVSLLPAVPVGVAAQGPPTWHAPVLAPPPCLLARCRCHRPSTPANQQRVTKPRRFALTKTGEDAPQLRYAKTLTQWQPTTQWQPNGRKETCQWQRNRGEAACQACQQMHTSKASAWGPF